MRNQAVTLLPVAKMERVGGACPWPSAATARSVLNTIRGGGWCRGPFPRFLLCAPPLRGAKTVWTTVGENATDALAARDRKQHLRQAKKLAVKAGVTIVKKDEVSHTLLARCESQEGSASYFITSSPGFTSP
jgi:hypothetical protein